MKQKAVIKVSMNGDKSRRKALKIAVGASGVESAGFKGDDKSQIEVTGDGLDAVVLTQMLRKKLGHADLLSVAPAGDEKKKETKESEPQIVPTYYYGAGSYYYEPYYYEPYNEPCNCSIM